MGALNGMPNEGAAGFADPAAINPAERPQQQPLQQAHQLQQHSQQQPQGNGERIVVFCVGNKLMLDDGLGCAVYDELVSAYEFPENVEVRDVGCMSLDMIDCVRTSDYIVTVDAVDSTQQPVGTIFQFAPDDIEVKRGASASLHELTLADLFEAATLLGYKAEGKCFGMQVENLSPAYATVGLTPTVSDRLPYLVDTVLADLVLRGVCVRHRQTGKQVVPGWHHVCA